MAKQKHTSLYFIQEHKDRKPLHGGVGNTDIESILLKLDFQPILFPCHDSFSLKAKIIRFTYLLKVLYSIPANSLIIFQFPMYARMNKLLLRLAGIRKKLTVICFITDIDGIKSGNKKLLAKERNELRGYRYFIVHNNTMQHWVNEIIPSAIVARIEFFDFLAEPFQVMRKKSYEIAFAGNLSKSGFLEKVDYLMGNNSDIVMNIYGEGITDKMKQQQMIRYKGIIVPALLPTIIEGSFGLVWDGDGSCNQQDSLFHYMPYISHHKLSLYILSSLPIIVYANAGSAELIEKYGIGITINSLGEIKDKLDAVSEESYLQMQENLKLLVPKIKSGGCLSEALSKLLNEIN